MALGILIILIEFSTTVISTLHKATAELYNFLNFISIERVDGFEILEGFIIPVICAEHNIQHCFEPLLVFLWGEFNFGHLALDCLLLSYLYFLDCDITSHPEHKCPFDLFRWRKIHIV